MGVRNRSVELELEKCNKIIGEILPDDFFRLRPYIYLGV